MTITQGEWREGERHENKVEIYSMVDGKHVQIARLYGSPIPVGCPSYKDMSDNARLIVAAPRLLAALEYVSQFLPRPDGRLETVFFRNDGSGKQTLHTHYDPEIVRVFEVIAEVRGTLR